MTAAATTNGIPGCLHYWLTRARAAATKQEEIAARGRGLARAAAALGRGRRRRRGLLPRLGLHRRPPRRRARRPEAGGGAGDAPERECRVRREGARVGGVEGAVGDGRRGTVFDFSFFFFGFFSPFFSLFFLYRNSLFLFRLFSREFPSPSRTPKKITKKQQLAFRRGARLSVRSTPAAPPSSSSSSSSSAPQQHLAQQQQQQPPALLATSALARLLPEDRSAAGPSYVEYLCWLHRQIQKRLM